MKIASHLNMLVSHTKPKLPPSQTLFPLTLHAPVVLSSADNSLANSLDSDQARHFVKPDLNQNCLTLIVFLIDFFFKKSSKRSVDSKKAF